MRSKERFLAALNLRKVDRVPLFEFLDSRVLVKSLTGGWPQQYNAEDAVECSLRLGMDAVWIPFGGGCPGYSIASDSDIYIDEWGTTYKRTEYSWLYDAPIAYPVKTKKDLGKLKIPDATTSDRRKDIQYALRLVKDRMAVIGGIDGPLTIAYLTMGYENLSLALYDDPKLVEKLHSIANDFLIEAAKKTINAGVDAICVAEDLGFHSGPFFSPSCLREFTFPYLGELIQEIRKQDIPVLLHSDGNLNLILDDLVEMGINALHPLESDAYMDLEKLKEDYGKKFCLIGGINHRVLVNGMPEDVKQEVMRTIEIASPGGGYIPSSDCGDWFDAMPLENIRAVIDTIKRCCYYY